MDYRLITKKIFDTKLIALFSNGETLDLTKFLRLSRIEMDFSNYVMPYYRFILKLPKTFILKINTDRDKVVFSFSSNFITTNAESKGLSLPFHEEIILKPLMDLNNPIDFTDSVINKGDKTSKEIKLDRYEFVAISEEVAKSNKPVTSGIYNNCTLSDVICDLTSNLKNRDVYLHPIDNKKVYEQIITLPSNVYNNIKFLDKVYGLYNRETKIFNNINKLNILPMSGFDSSKVGGINIDVLFNSNSPDTYNIEGSYSEKMDNDKNIYNKNIATQIHNVSLIDNTRLYTELFGTEINLFGVDNESGTKIKNYKKEKKDRNGNINKVRVLEDVYDNEYNLKNNLNRKEEVLLKLQLNDIDLNFDDLFKEFKIVFHNDYYSNYNGKYEILSINQDFVRGKEAYAIKNNITLRKI